MFWADKIAKKIIQLGKYQPYWIDDMKTPSGRIHVGSLRGVVIHDLVYKALLHEGVKATFTYLFEDHDPMDALPHYLDEKKWRQYLGKPLFTIPSPDGKDTSFAHYFAHEFQEVFNNIGSTPEILWTSDLYTTGKMNEGIKICLDQVTVIRDIYETTYKKKLPENWYPFQVVCLKCGKMSTTKVTEWDGIEVEFECKVDAVNWTRGCGYKGKASPFSGDGKFVGKLSWKVEWPLKWQVVGVTVEGAGKDHMSAGGSHDIAKQICDRVLHYPVPYPVAYEFFLVGGKKMSSSKGLGSSAKEISEVLPPYLLRFLFTRTDFNQTIDFDPVGNMYIPDLFDEYDRCWQAFIQMSDENLSRSFELAQVDRAPDKEKIYLPRFRDIVTYIQNTPINELPKKFAEDKGELLTFEEEKVLRERIDYASIWIQKYAPEEYRLQFSQKLPKEIKTLTNEQKKYLKSVITLLNKYTVVEDLNVALYNLAKELSINTKEAFAAIYIAFIGKTHGPRAAWFLLQYPKDRVVKRLQEVTTKTQIAAVKLISKPESFTVDPQVNKTYPLISIGIAFIKGVRVQKNDTNLEREKVEFLKSLGGITTEMLGKYPEVVSYRRLYKEMGIDWHSRRPSPEALLRRVVLGKGLYTVNTCVDAYNLVVLKQRVSVGAFDADKVKFPTILQFAKAGDEIILLGDKEPTKYSSKELAYYDQVGGYNIDFNFRDAQRTKVTEATKNLWINVDGVYDILPIQVEKTLDEAVKKIIKFCGGVVEFQGVIK